MSGIRHDAQIRFGPGLVQIPAAAHGTDHVETSLHDGGGDVTNFRNVVEQPGFPVEERAIGEVVALDARKGRAKSASPARLT